MRTNSVQDAWNGFLSTVAERSASTASLLEKRGRLLSLDEGTATVQLRGLTDADRDQLFDTRSRKRLEAALATALGRRLRGFQDRVEGLERAKTALENDLTESRGLLKAVSGERDALRRDLARVRLFSTADLWSLLVLGPEDLRGLAARAPVTNTDDSMFVELRAPWYLYDDTPATTTLIQELLA